MLNKLIEPFGSIDGPLGFCQNLLLLSGKWPGATLVHEMTRISATKEKREQIAQRTNHVERNFLLEICQVSLKSKVKSLRNLVFTSQRIQHKSADLQFEN